MHLSHDRQSLSFPNFFYGLYGLAKTQCQNKIMSMYIGFLATAHLPLPWLGLESRLGLGVRFIGASECLVSPKPPCNIGMDLINKG